MSELNPLFCSDEGTENIVAISSLLPDLISNYIIIRDQRLALDKQAAEIKETEDVLNKAIIAKMKEEKVEVAGKIGGFVKMKKNVEPTADDWPAVWKYIKENDAFELLHKRLTSEAVKERWENNVEIPGVGRKDVYKLSVSKT
jgi:hypothetical protein